MNSLDRANKGTEIARVRGLGSAHQGAHEWGAMHATSAASLVLGAYLVFSFLLLPDFAYPTLRAWLSGLVPSLAVALMVVAFFRHTQHGLKVLIEDYVHTPGTKYACLLALNLVTFALAAFGVACIARIVVGAMVDASAKETTAQVQQAVQTMLGRMQGGAGGQP